LSGGNTVTLTSGAAVNDILEAVSFVPFTSGLVLAPSNNLSDVANAGTARTNLGLGDASTKTVGIGSGNVGTFAASVADNDFLKIDGTTVEGRSSAEVLSDIGGQASLTFGIANTNAVKVDSASVADDEYARFTASGLESRSTAEVLSDIGGQASLTFGIANTNAVKVDHASVADDDYAKFTASGVEGRSYAEVLSDIGGQASLTFGIANTNAVKVDHASVADNDYAKFTSSGVEGRSYAEVLSDIGGLSTSVASSTYAPLAGAAFTGGVTVTTADNSAQINIKSTDADANVGPRLVLQRDSGTPADYDLLGQIEFYGENDNDEAIEYAKIYGNVYDATDGTEDAGLGISTKVNTTTVSRLWMSPTESVFNFNNIDLDFRVASDTVTNALFVDGATGNVGIGCTPAKTLDISLPASTNGDIIRIARANGAYYWHIGQTDGSVFYISNNGGSQSFQINPDGNVGIGTVAGAMADNSRLTIAGADNSNYLAIRNTSASDGSSYRWGYIRFEGTQSGSEVSTLARIGAFHDGSADDQKGVFTIATNDGDDGANPTERIRLASAGQIGIGGANYGTSGQVLTSAGASSAPSWADAGGGGAFTLLETVTITSNTATAVLDISEYSSTYDNFMVTGHNIGSDTNDDTFKVMFNTDWQGGTNYTWQDLGYYALRKAKANATDIQETYSSTGIIFTDGGAGGNAYQTMSFVGYYYDMHSTTNTKHVRHHGSGYSGYSDNPTNIFDSAQVFHDSPYHAVHQIRYQFGSNNIARGVFKLYGIAKS
jgi:hypothetical protein